MIYERNPSTEFRKGIALHRAAHAEGVIRIDEQGTTQREGRKIFEGSEILYSFPVIIKAVKKLAIRHCLDFGCGKANAYRLPFTVEGTRYRHFYHATGLDPAGVYLYDPGVPQFQQPPRPEQSFDLVISTDVLEHIPEQDIDMVLDYLFAKARKAMVLSIACHESITFLPGGVNAHLTVKPPKWWQEKIAERRKKKPIAVWCRYIEKSREGKFDVQYQAIGVPKDE